MATLRMLSWGWHSAMTGRGEIVVSSSFNVAHLVLPHGAGHSSEIRVCRIDTDSVECRRERCRLSQRVVVLSLRRAGQPQRRRQHWLRLGFEAIARGRVQRPAGSLVYLAGKRTLLASWTGSRAIGDNSRIKTGH